MNNIITRKKLFEGLNEQDLALFNTALGLLTTCPEGSDIPYAQIPEVMGGFCYEIDVRNFDTIVAMADRKWTPMSGIDLAEGIALDNESSELDAIIQNFFVYEFKRQGYSMADVDKIKNPDFILKLLGKTPFKDALNKFLSYPSTSHAYCFSSPDDLYDTMELHER